MDLKASTQITLFFLEPLLVASKTLIAVYAFSYCMTTFFFFGSILYHLFAPPHGIEVSAIYGIAAAAYLLITTATFCIFLILEKIISKLKGKNTIYE